MLVGFRVRRRTRCVGPSLRFTLGYVGGALVAAFFVHLVLAFPSGRLETKAERCVAAGMYAVALVLQPAWMLFDDLHNLKCNECPANAFLIDQSDTVAYVFGLPTLAAVLGVLLAVVAILVRRWRAASRPLRRVLAPVYLTSAATIAILVVENAVAPFARFGADVFDWLFVVALSTVPVAFLGGLMRTHLARTNVAELMTEFGETPAPGHLRHALARALGDPSLELAYWVCATASTWIPTGMWSTCPLRTLPASPPPSRARDVLSPRSYDASLRHHPARLGGGPPAGRMAAVRARGPARAMAGGRSGAYWRPRCSFCSWLPLGALSPCRPCPPRQALVSTAGSLVAPLSVSFPSSPVIAPVV